MQVLVKIHLEGVPEEPGYSWWAESDGLPGYSAAAESLPELLRRINASVPEVLAEAGRSIDGLRIVPRLVADESTGGDAVVMDVSVGRNSDEWDPVSPVGFSVRQVAVAVPA